MQLTKRQKDTINAIIGTKTRIALDNEALRDDVAALAIELGMQPAQVNKLINTIIREMNKGGIIEEEVRLLELAEQAISGDDAQ